LYPAAVFGGGAARIGAEQSQSPARVCMFDRHQEVISMRKISFRFWFGGSALACVLLLAYAIYEQKVMGLEPCPLCIFQRIGFIAVAVIMALGSLHNPGALGRKCYGLLAALAALAGGAVAARHVWLRHLPPDQVPDCGPGLAYMLDAFPLGKTITSVFTGSGECAAADGWMFLHLDMPSWTLIWFAGLLLVAVYGGFRARG